MWESLVATQLLTPLAHDMVRQALKGMGHKYSVDMKTFQYVISTRVEEEFQHCLDVAVRAFMNALVKDRRLSPLEQKAILDYLKSPLVADEVWHLLDPGSEYFDRGRLTQSGYTQLHQHLNDLEPQSVFDAWEEFLKAFSFASRSKSELREFLRASYEAGSFNALSNIENVLEKITIAIGEIQTEEIVTRQSIKGYIDDLKAYKDWARSFQVE